MNIGEGGFDRIIFYRQSGLQCLHGCRSEGGVLALVFSGEGGVVFGVHESDGAGLFERGLCLQQLWRAEGGDALLEDAGFFGCDLGERLAEVLLVVERDGGDDSSDGGDDVGGIEPPAETGFEQDDVASFAREMFEGHHGDDFKKGGQLPGGKLAEQCLHAFGEKHGLRLGDGFAVDLNAFAKADEMRRGVQAGFVSRRAVNTLEHGTHGAFAVGAGDVDDF